MAQTWPETLPTYFIGQRYSERARDSVIRTKNDIGPVSLRNRYTTVITDITASMNLTQDQVDILNEFYNVTLGAVLTFDMTNPITSEVRELRFVSPPAFTHIGGEYYSVSLILETV